MQKPKKDFQQQSMKSPIRSVENILSASLPQFKTTTNLPQLNRPNARSKSRNPSTDKVKAQSKDDRKSNTTKKSPSTQKKVKVIDDEPELKLKRAPSPSENIPLRQSMKQLKPVNKRNKQNLGDNNPTRYTTQPIETLVGNDNNKSYSSKTTFNNDVISSYVNLIKGNIIKKSDATAEVPNENTKKAKAAPTISEYNKIAIRALIAIVDRHRYSRIQKTFLYVQMNSQYIKSKLRYFVKSRMFKLKRKILLALRNLNLLENHEKNNQALTKTTSLDKIAIDNKSMMISCSKSNRKEIDEAIRSYLPKPQKVDESPLKASKVFFNQKNNKQKKPIESKESLLPNKLPMKKELDKSSDEKDREQDEEEDDGELMILMAKTFRKDKCIE